MNEFYKAGYQLFLIIIVGIAFIILFISAIEPMLGGYTTSSMVTAVILAIVLLYVSILIDKRFIKHDRRVMMAASSTPVISIVPVIENNMPAIENQENQGTND